MSGALARPRAACGRVPALPPGPRRPAGRGRGRAGRCRARKRTRERAGRRSRSAEAPEGADAPRPWLDRLAPCDPGAAGGWAVPWGGGAVAGGMLAWVLCFGFVGVVLTPAAGVGLGLLGPEGVTGPKSGPYLLFVNQCLETAAGLGALYLVVKRATPEGEELPPDLFAFGAAGGDAAWRPEDGWALWALVGMAATPVAVGATALAMAAAGLQDTSGSGTADVVVSTLSTDPAVEAAVFSVTSVLAPALEEVVFRGFLLTSLTKWMGVVPASLVSAGFFGAAHLSARDLPQLCAVGTVLGLVYSRSKNLLTPMLVHSFWNSGVLLLLLYLIGTGQDVERLLHAG